MRSGSRSACWRSAGHGGDLLEAPREGVVQDGRRVLGEAALADARRRERRAGKLHVRGGASRPRGRNRSRATTRRPRARRFSSASSSEPTTIPPRRLFPPSFATRSPPRWRSIIRRRATRSKRACSTPRRHERARRTLFQHAMKTGLRLPPRPASRTSSGRASPCVAARREDDDSAIFSKRSQLRALGDPRARASRASWERHRRRRRRVGRVFASRNRRAALALPSGVRASAFAPLSSRRAFASGSSASRAGSTRSRDAPRTGLSNQRESVAADVRTRAHVFRGFGHAACLSGSARGVRGLRRARARPRVRSRGFHPIPRLLRFLLRPLHDPRPESRVPRCSAASSPDSAAARSASTGLPSASPPRSCPASKPPFHTPTPASRRSPRSSGRASSRASRRPDEDRTDGVTFHPLRRAHRRPDEPRQNQTPKPSTDCVATLVVRPGACSRRGRSRSTIPSRAPGSVLLGGSAKPGGAIFSRARRTKAARRASSSADRSRSSITACTRVVPWDRPWRLAARAAGW